eukprot:Skav204717  [mRNA]  locus=scaffold1549:131088:134900:+ [translate_table: standard]
MSAWKIRRRLVLQLLDLPALRSDSEACRIPYGREADVTWDTKTDSFLMLPWRACRVPFSYAKTTSDGLGAREVHSGVTRLRVQWSLPGATLDDWQARGALVENGASPHCYGKLQEGVQPQAGACQTDLGAFELDAPVLGTPWDAGPIWTANATSEALMRDCFGLGSEDLLNP